MTIAGQPVEDMKELVAELTATFQLHEADVGVVGACMWTVRNLSGHEGLCGVLAPLLPILLQALGRHGAAHDVLDEALAALGNMARRRVIPGEATRVLLSLLAHVASGRCTLEALERVAWCAQCLVGAGPVDVDTLTPPLVQALGVRPPHGPSLCSLMALLHVLADSVFDVHTLRCTVKDAHSRLRRTRRRSDDMEEREIMAEGMPLVLAALDRREVRVPPGRHACT